MNEAVISMRVLLSDGSGPPPGAVSPPAASAATPSPRPRGSRSPTTPPCPPSPA